jgi:hypothetical protein
MAVTKQQWKAMLAYARPMVNAGEDWQAVQHGLLNHFDFLTNSDEHEELTMDVIRQCETELELREGK